MRIVRPVVRTVGGLTHTVRDINRLREVAAILVRHGFGWLVQTLDLPGLDRASRDQSESTPERAVAALKDLGPTFIKLGQVLSTRPDVVPAAYLAAFQSLQDDVGPLPFPEIERTLSAELGSGWRAGLSRFDEAPLATASIAQVHRAALQSGAEIVFKVQRPGIAAMIRADLSILHLLVNRLCAEFPEAELLDPQGVLSEFERSITAELDFLAEATNMRRFTTNFAGNPRVKIPTIFDALTTSRVLCIEHLDGVKIRQAREHGYDMDEVGRRYLEVAYTMLFDHGFFHGDLHPGNVLILPGHVIGLLDFGMVGRLTRDMKDSIVSLLFALERGDYRTISRIFFDIAIKSERVDYDAFERDTTLVVERNWEGVSVQEMQIGRFLLDITEGALKHRVRAPPTYTTFFKALLTTEGLAKSLIPEVDPLGAARPYVQRLVSERFSSQRTQEDLFYNLVTLSTLARRLPTSLSQLLDDIDDQRLRLNIVTREDPQTSQRLDQRLRAQLLGAFAVTAALCAALSLPYTDMRLFGLPALSLVLFFLAGAFGLMALVAARRG